MLPTVLALVLAAAPAGEARPASSDHLVPPVVRVDAFDATNPNGPPLPPEVIVACAVLKVVCLPGSGGVTLILTAPIPMPVVGLAMVWPQSPCTRVAWATKDPQIVAHEMAHLLGLDHVMEEGNIMFPAHQGGGFALQNLQRQRLYAGARRLSRLCAPKRP